MKIWKVKAYLRLFIDCYHMNYKEKKNIRMELDRCIHAMAKNKQCSYILWLVRTLSV